MEDAKEAKLHNPQESNDHDQTRHRNFTEEKSSKVVE